MASPDQATSIDRPLLLAAIAAVEGNDIGRADTLFIEHLAKDRADPVGLAEYGNFCLRTGRHEAALYLLHKAIQLSPPDADLLTQLGFAKLETSDTDGAQRSFEAALKYAPTHPLANYGLAQCNQQSGAWPAAVKGFNLALAEQPGNLSILLTLADACQHAGDAQAAKNHYERASRLAPNDPSVLFEYGKFLHGQNMHDRALALFTAVRQAHPDEPTVVLETARCQLAMGDHAAAFESLEKLDRITPNTPEYHEAIGNCLASTGDAQRRDLHWGFAADLRIRAQQYALAGPLLDKMLDANPAYAVAWNLKGMLHEAQQQFALAEAAYEQSIKADPVWLDGYANLANLHERTNRIPQAIAVSDAGLAMASSTADQPGNSRICLLVLSCKVARRQKDYARAIHLLDQVDQFEQSDLDRQLAAFERGKVMDLLGNEADAISAFNLGNALARAPWMQANPGENTFLRGIEYMLGLVSNDWLNGWRKIDASSPETDPAFLVGFPRSGTSLLTQVLYCHSAIQIVEEKPLVQAMRDCVRSMPAGYPHAIADFDNLDVAYLQEVYFRAAAQHGVAQSPELLVDKFPLHVTMAGLIHRVFPKARFIFAVRHPCDAVLSCFMQGFRSNEAMANFHTLADTVKLFTKTMDLWQAYREQLPLSVHTIRYEDVVDDFDGQVRALCDFLQVPWEEGLRQFSTRALDRGRINTPSYEQVSKPIYREARYRWERYRKHLEPFLPALHPYIERFGYAD